MNLIAITLVGICGLALIASALLLQGQHRKLNIEAS